ncbi:hypothetical protein EBU91_05035 [bacterium]|nr:hypothetical protein [bacterium]
MFHFVKHIIVIVIIVGLVLYFGFNIKNQNDLNSAYEKSLQDAKSYVPSPDKICAEVITTAINQLTNAKYDFPTSCIPDGWKATSK